ncbi:hypothetical protein GCM10027261_31330 [Geodermatophilus arenarius]|uniref:Secreted protein n=1 Tax=Geodermatophilus arenarius TaxID=1137990 RepID=A0ABV9LKJ7_9ACTN
MGWAIASVVGFVVLTALVTAMARSNTARWERDHRAAQAAARAHAAAARSAWTAALRRARPEPPEEPRHGSLHLPHVRLPAGLVDRLPHPQDWLPRHLPHLHLPVLRLPGRVRDEREPEEPPRAGAS